MTATVERAINYGLLIFFSVLALAPIVGVVLTAFHGPDALVSGLAFPHPFTTDSFRVAWTDGSFGSSLVTSAKITLATVAFSTVFSVLTGLRVRDDALPRREPAVLHLPASGFSCPSRRR